MQNVAPDMELTLKVDFTAEAWRQVGSLNQEDFTRLQRALNLAATEASARPSQCRFSSLPLPLDGRFALYELDEERQLITVLRIVDRLPETDPGA